MHRACTAEDRERHCLYSTVRRESADTDGANDEEVKQSDHNFLWIKMNIKRKFNTKLLQI